MCGRYSQAADLAKLAKRFGLRLPVQRDERRAKPRYNLAPSEEAPVIVLQGGERRLEWMRWGLTRQWGKDKPPIFVINLRAEKVAQGPFKALLSRQRCLIPADGFYEWKTEGKKKQPYRFTMKDEGLFALPAIYDEPAPEVAGAPRTFCIFTTEPNTLVAPVHHRMPAILTPEEESAWLDPALTDISKVVALLKPYPVEAMQAWPVSTLINSAKYDDIDLTRPLPQP